LHYKPKTGINAGKSNFKKIQDYLEKNPEATGVEIHKTLGLSLPTVYGHLNKMREETA
jgi:Mn-dependent DtxR family transcriptional regulator